MRIIKLALTLAGLIVASQGRTYDLTNLVQHAVMRSLPGAAQAGTSGLHGSQHRDRGTSIDVQSLRLPAANGSFAACKSTFANGMAPRVPTQSQSGTRALCFNGFAVLYSAHTKTPVYSAEVLTRQRIEGAHQRRTNAFFEDARLPAAERALLDDYRGSTFDRGHTSPAGDMNTPEGMAQSFSLANMVPQAPDNNRFSWADIEKATRKYALRAKGNVYVITGPAYTPGSCPFVLGAQRQLQARGATVPQTPDEIVRTASKQAGFKAPYRYDAQRCTIGKSQVAVPSQLFKLVYDQESNRAWVHWMDNTDWAKVGRPISYEELVRRTGIEFLPGIKPAG